MQIVRDILKDINSNYATHKEFDWIHPVMKLKLLENWRYEVSKKLYQAGVGDIYEPVNVLHLDLEQINDRLLLEYGYKEKNYDVGEENWMDVQYGKAETKFLQALAHNLVQEEGVDIRVVARAMGVKAITAMKCVRD
ncbi:hypothetical protein JQN58_01470 [Aneurinibacillus sp. BA2021]|nr:hypothetical protein [Aneurinibacillus sp. BA2021]